MAFWPTCMLLMISVMLVPPICPERRPVKNMGGGGRVRAYSHRLIATQPLEEEGKLIEAGFEYVRYSEKDEVAIYRKRK